MTEEYGSRRVVKQDRADPKLLFMQQVTRCLQTADTHLFDANVTSLLTMLPTASFYVIKDMEDEYTADVESFEYVKCLGYRVGREDNPMLWDKDGDDMHLANESKDDVRRVLGEVDWEDPNIAGSLNNSETDEPWEEPVLFDEKTPVKRHLGEIDWSDKRIYSPKLEITDTTLYDILFRLILSEAQEAGIWWDQGGGGLIGLPSKAGEALKTSKKAERTPKQ